MITAYPALQLGYSADFPAKTMETTMKFRTSLWMITVAVVALAFCVGCSDDDDPVSPPVTHDATETIGVAGGEISIVNMISLEIPQNALTADVDFTIDELENGYTAMPADRILVSSVWEIGPAETTFSSPADLVIKYDESVLTTQSEADLVIYTDEGAGWVPVVTSIVDDQDEAEADIDHLSQFCVTAPLPGVAIVDITLSATPALAIPDGPNGGGPGLVATSTINVVPAGIVDDIRVYVDITHAYSSDLIIKLEAPDGTLHNVFWIGEGGEPNTNPVGWYPDDFTPKQDFALLDGKSVRGDWKLHCYDYSYQQAGTLNEWRLNLFYEPFVK